MSVGPVSRARSSSRRPRNRSRGRRAPKLPHLPEGALHESLRLPLRLVALGFVTVVVQQACVSQVTVFGVSADLTPLVVMSVGLLAGSMAGAIMGFSLGMLVDLVLVQTLGITSLLYIAIGYWCGRLRELRDPAHGLVPLAAGAAATALAGIGMTLIQFLLGVDAPVSLVLVQQIFVTVLVNALISLPGLRARAPGGAPGAARGSAPAPAPRLYDRRSEPAAPALRATRTAAEVFGAMNRLPEDKRLQFVPQEQRAPLTPQLALRVAVLGSLALAMFAIIFFRLWFLQVLSGDQYLAQASSNRARSITVSAPRGQILDRSGTRARRLHPGSGRAHLAARPAGADHHGAAQQTAARRRARL